MCVALCIQPSLAHSESFTPLPEGYHLVYGVEGLTHYEKKLPAGATWSVREVDGALLIELLGAGEESYRFLYRDGKSLSLYLRGQKESASPKSSGQYFDTFEYSRIPVFPFLPFNFRTFPIYDRIDRIFEAMPPETHSDARAKVGSIPYSIFAFNNVGNGRSVPMYLPAEFEWNQGLPVRLRAGAGTKIFADVSYSDWRPLGDAVVPGRIVGRRTDTGEVIRTFRLVKAEINPQAIPPIEQLIPEGQFLAIDINRKSASIEFDPKAGSLDEQIEKVLKIWERVDRDQKIAEQNRQRARIPLIISGVLAGLAVFLVVVRNWPRRK
jgi:hypothetical protein